MASPPFNIAETTPGNTDVAANFPAAERTFRDVVESWLSVEHNTYGFHKVQNLSTTNKNAQTNWSVGSFVYDTDLDVLQILIDDDPSDVWDTLSFPAGTRMLFQQTSAPPGWTKVTDAAYHNSAIRLTTGTVSSGGDVAFTDIFSATYAISDETEDYTLLTADIPAHSHVYSGTAVPEDNNNTATKLSPLREGSSGLAAAFSTADVGATDAISNTGGGGAHAHDIDLTLDIALKYRDVILCAKD